MNFKRNKVKAHKNACKKKRSFAWSWSYGKVSKCLELQVRELKKEKQTL